MSILENELFITAVERIALRAEYRDTNSNIYINTGQLSKLSVDDNQIIYGRRGTGKTHLLQAYQDITKDGTLAIYIDLRKVQDAPLAPGLVQSSVGLAALKSYQQLIMFIANEYENYLDSLIKTGDYKSETTPEIIMELISRLVDLSKGEWHSQGTSEENDTLGLELTVSESSSSNTKFSFAPKTANFEVGLTSNDSLQNKENSSFSKKTTEELRIPFSKIIMVLEELNKSLRLDRTILLLDEWSSIPLDMQPYFAEWLKRSFFASSKFSAKIACIRYQSNLSYISQSSRVGFEVGGDIFVGVDLDDILVFDKNREAVSSFFAKLLYNHMTDAHGLLADPEQNQGRFVNDIFSERRAYEEILKASEGIPRDFLYIFASSFRRAQEHPNWKSIGVPAIVEAAKDFYHRDKMTDARPEYQEVMETLIREVIKHRKVKAFLVPQRLSNSITLQELMNARLLHRWHIGYAAKSATVGERYDIYAIDYGAYVDLRETNIGRDLNESMFEDSYENGEVPPTIDKRAVRHIVLDEKLLETFDQLLEGSIECPNCHTKFSPKQKSYVIKSLCPHCFEYVPNTL